MRSKIPAALALAVMLSATGAFAAAPAHRGGDQTAPGHHRAWHRHQRPLISFMLEHRDDLALTPEQVRRLEQIRNDFQAQAKQTVATLRSSRSELRQFLAADAVDMARVEEKVRDIERLRGDLTIARLRAVEEGKAQLTTEQRARLAALIAQAAPVRRGQQHPNAS